MLSSISLEKNVFLGYFPYESLTSNTFYKNCAFLAVVVVVCLDLTSLSTIFQWHIMTVSGCDRELSAHFYSAASPKYHAADTWHDTTPSHIILTLGRPGLNRILTFASLLCGPLCMNTLKKMSGAHLLNAFISDFDWLICGVLEEKTPTFG